MDEAKEREKCFMRCKRSAVGSRTSDLVPPVRDSLETPKLNRHGGRVARARFGYRCRVTDGFSSKCAYDFRKISLLLNAERSDVRRERDISEDATLATRQGTIDEANRALSSGAKDTEERASRATSGESSFGDTDNEDAATFASVDRRSMFRVEISKLSIRLRRGRPAAGGK